MTSKGEFAMNIKEFARKLKQNNLNQKKRFIISFAVLIMTLFVGDSSDYTNDMYTNSFNIFDAFFLIMIVATSINYYEIFLKLPYSKSGIISMISYNMEDLVSYNSFDIKEYFNMLIKKSFIWQGIVLIINIIWCVSFFKMLIFSVAIIILPLLVGLFKRTVLYENEHKRHGKVCYIIQAFLNTIIIIADIFICIIYLWLALVMLQAIFESMAFSINEDEIVYISPGLSMMTGALFLIYFLLVLLLVLFDMKYKHSAIILIAAAAVYIISSLACIVVNANNYVMITDNKIIVKSFAAAKEYAYDDVKDYELQSDSDTGLSLTMTFIDGTACKVPMDTTIYSDAYTEKYDNDDQYLKEIGQRIQNKMTN